MTKELRDNVEWIRVTESKEESGRLLDYACGGGVATRVRYFSLTSAQCTSQTNSLVQALAPYFEFLCGIDISAGMLKEFDRLAGEAGYGKEKMKAVRGDLLDPEGTPAPELAEPEYFNFDTVTMAFALHHVEDVETMLRRLVERARPGGTVLIVDLVGKERKDLPEGMGVAHGGFMEDQMQKLFEKVGLENWGWRLFKDQVEMPFDHGGAKTVFMARGVRPASSEQQRLKEL